MPASPTCDQVHRHVAHRFIVLDLEQFEPVGDGADGRDDVVTDAAAQKGRKIEIADWLCCIGHGFPGAVIRFRIYQIGLDDISALTIPVSERKAGYTP